MLNLEELLSDCFRDVHRQEMKAADIVLSVYDAEQKTFAVVPEDASDVKRLHELLMNDMPRCRVLALGRSRCCRQWADCGEALPPLTLRHARYFLGEVCNTGRIQEDNAQATVDAIMRHFRYKKPEHVPAVFVPATGAVTWADEVEDAVKQLLVLEEGCDFALRLQKHVRSCYTYLPAELLYEEYYRHHGLGPSPIQRGDADLKAD